MLDKNDITALRKASAVSFHRRKDGESYIRASLKTNGDMVFTSGTEAERCIPCDSSLSDYETVKLTDWCGFEMIHTAQLHEEWQTVAKLLRTGDTIALEWGRGAAGTDGIRECGMVGDRLCLHVHRGDKRKALSFFISQYVGQNNTARMVKAA